MYSISETIADHFEGICRQLTTLLSLSVAVNYHAEIGKREPRSLYSNKLSFIPCSFPSCRQSEPYPLIVWIMSDEMINNFDIYWRHQHRPGPEDRRHCCWSSSSCRCSVIRVLIRMNEMIPLPECLIFKCIGLMAYIRINISHATKCPTRTIKFIIMQN